jgi:hypothetical protein
MAMDYGLLAQTMLTRPFRFGGTRGGTRPTQPKRPLT